MNPPVGTRIKVLWLVDKTRYPGIISEYTTHGKAVVNYDDGDEEILDLEEENWVLETDSSIESTLMMTPRIIECARETNSQYVPVFEFKKEQSEEPKFRIPGPYSADLNSLAHIAFSQSFLGKLCDASNKYAQEKNNIDLNLRQSELLRFFSIYYYMGVVKLPDKYDYWSTDVSMPTHWFCSSMSRLRFKQIWANIHCETATTNISNTSDIESDEEQELEIESIQTKNVWFSKAQQFVDHTRNVSSSMLLRPGTAVCIDEMMVRFKGRSSETYRIKNKPVNQGYKLFAMCDSNTGYVCYFTPDGRIANKNGTNEFSQANAEGGKLYHMFMLLFDNVLKEHVSKDHRFVIFIDNYFSYPNTISAFRKLGVGIAGTARPKSGWPPFQLKVPENFMFNDLFWCTDDCGTLVMKWIDNNEVFIVSTAHMPTSSIMRNRRKPRQTSTNKAHIETVWGQNSVRQIKIPAVIDDYNHNMNGVDIADQRIASYNPNFRCNRTWFPIMFHCLNILRNNCFVVFQKLIDTRGTRQKDFLLQFIRALE